MDNNLNLKSELHKINNYIFRFSRYTRTKPNDFINQIDIMSLDNINIYSIKFNTYNADILMMVFKLLYVDGEPFEYNIPSFNMFEVFKINGSMDFPNDQVVITLSISRQTLYDESSLHINFNPEEYEEFMFLFYFMFLIDLE